MRGIGDGITRGIGSIAEPLAYRISATADMALA
jgi:hypothetical protein